MGSFPHLLQAPLAAPSTTLSLNQAPLQGSCGGALILRKGQRPEALETAARG